MKIYRIVKLTPAVALAISAATAIASDQMTIGDLRSEPCRSLTSVNVTAYLHSSRHGAWLSQGPGTNGGGMPLELSHSLDRSQNELFFQHLRDPRVYRISLFKARFSGHISCNKRGVPVLHVEQVDSIRVTPIRDAG